jgi:hypothetical protein
MRQVSFLTHDALDVLGARATWSRWHRAKRLQARHSRASAQQSCLKPDVGQLAELRLQY